MTEHVKWTDPAHPRMSWDEIRTATGARVIRETRAWVKGYIKALEDVLDDLYVQETDYVNDSDAKLAIDMIRNKVQESLDSADATLSALNEIREAGDGQKLPTPAREAEAP